jgi:hypothetical protein
MLAISVIFTYFNQKAMNFIGKNFTLSVYNAENNNKYSYNISYLVAKQTQHT